MSSSAFHGTPCLVPVQIRAEAQAERRGFITRLSTLAAAVSSDPALVLGQTVTLLFKRPSDAEPLEASGTVGSLLPEGGLWRGRPAALVEFEAAVELEEGGLQFERFQRASDGIPVRLDAGTGQTAGLGSALGARGLGRRKRTGRLRRPPTPPNPFGAVKLTVPPTGEPISGTPPTVESAAELEAAFFDDESTAPPARRADEDSTVPPPDQFGPPSVGFADLFSLDDATVPPKGGKPEPEPTSDTARIELEFMNQFGSGEVGDYGLPPGAYEEPGGYLSDDVPGELPDEAIARVSAHSIEVARDGARDEDTAPAPSRPWSAVDSSTAPPVQDSGAIAQPPNPRTGERPPWEEGPDDLGTESFLPRNARIASTINVHFWARGRRNRAIADNFSREGLFLTYADTPPVRGAIVRVEFPLEGEHESLPVRFNGEVRWHRADRPGAGLPDGFGVQILTFETPKDRARYEELLDAILALGPASEPAEHGFSWGTGGGLPT